MKPIQLPPVSPDPDYSAIDPLDSRYYDPEIARQETLKALRHRGINATVTITNQQEPTPPIRLC